MNDKSNSQAQQIRDDWRKAVGDHAGRIEAAFAEVAKIEEKGIEHACRQIDEAARLTRVSLAYGSELAAQWRKLVVEATRRTAEMVAGPGGV